MKRFAVYMNDGNRAIVRARTWELFKTNIIAFKDGEATIALFNFNNIQGLEELGEVKDE